MGKEIITQVQETQRVLHRINPTRNMARHQTYKNTRTSKGKTTNNTQGDSHKDNRRSFNRNFSDQKGMAVAAAAVTSVVSDSATPYTAAHQAPSSLGFTRQEHWSGLLFPSPMHESEK